MHIRVWSSGRPWDDLPYPLQEIRWGTFSRSTSRSNPCLQAIAYVLCAPSVGSLVLDSLQLCVGLLEPYNSSVVPLGSASVTVSGATVLSRATPADYGRGVSWTLALRILTPNMTMPDGEMSQFMYDIFEETRPAQTPSPVLANISCWLAGLGEREVSPYSSDEITLAKHLLREYVTVSASGPPQWPGTLISEARHMTEVYLARSPPQT